MKKFWLMLMMICSVCAFTACSDDDETTPEENGGNGTPVCPVKNVTLDKTTAQIGDQIIMSGEGFVAGAKLYLKGSAEIEIPYIAITSNGKSVTFIVPEVEARSYTFVLEQDGKWPLEVTLNVEKVKRLSGFTCNSPALNFKLNYNAEGKVTSITQTEAGKDPYEYFTFTYSNDSIYITMNSNGANPRSQGHVVYQEKQITSCNANNWTYTQDGYLEKTITGTAKIAALLDTREYTYDNGNLKAWSNTYMGSTIKITLDYGKNSPEAKGIDVSLLLATTIGGGVSSPVYAANLLNLCGNISKQLPSEIVREYDGKTYTFSSHKANGNGLITEVVMGEMTMTFTWE